MTDTQEPADQRSLEERLHHLETELAETRKRLYETMARLKFMEQADSQAASLENITDGVIFTNADDEVTYANPRFLEMVCAASPEMVLFRPLPDTLWELPQEKVRLFRDLHAGRYVRDRELVLRTFNNKRLVVLCNITPVHDDSGSFVGGATAFRDITDKRALEMELRQQNEAYLRLVDKLQGSLNALRETQSQLMAEANLAFASDLSAGLLHELSNAVSLIEVRAYFLERTWCYDPDALSNVQAIREATERISAVLASLRNLPRHHEHPAPVNLQDLLTEVVTDLTASNVLGSAEVILTLAETPLVIEGHRGHVQQAVRNLILNAGEALSHLPADRQRQIECRLSLVGTWAHIDIIDNGPGFESRVLAQLFRPGNSTKSVSGVRGLGLGLFVAHQVAEAHGGSLSVKSEPGAGATVSLEFPLVSFNPQT